MNAEYYTAQFLRYAPFTLEACDQIRVKLHSPKGETNWLNITASQARAIEEIISPEPIPSTWEDWSRAVIDLLIDRLEVSNGDAQGIYEAHPSLAARIWHADYTPAQAAEAIERTHQ